MAKYEGYGADIEIDDDRLLLTKKGMSAKLIGSTGVRRIPLQALTGVNFKDATRLTNGWLQLVIAGEVAGKGEASDPNTVMFRHRAQGQFAALRDYLLAAIEKNRELGVDPTAVAYDPAATTRLQALEERQAELEEGSHLRRREVLTQQLGGPGVAREDIVEAAASMRWRLGGGREIRKLLEHLQPGEVVRKIGQGTYRDGQGIVVLTDSRLLFLFHGIAHKALEDFPLSVITSISTTSGVISGDLRVFASGNEAVISNVIKADLEMLATALRQEVARIKSSSQADRSEGRTPPNPLDQIAKLAELRDAGILSSDEFEAKKAELLGRL